MYTKKPEIFFSHYHNARCRLRTIFFFFSVFYYFYISLLLLCCICFFFTPSDYPNNSFFSKYRHTSRLPYDYQFFTLRSIYTCILFIRVIIYLFIFFVFYRFRLSIRRITYDCSVRLVWPVGFHINLINYRRQQQSLHRIRTVMAVSDFSASVIYTYTLELKCYLYSCHTKIKKF